MPRANASTVECELTFGELAPGGDAVAHGSFQGQGRAVFLRNGAPGERAKVRVDLSRSPARAELLEVLEASPHRVEPPCGHWKACGACDWMHIATPAQEHAHVDHLRRALPPAHRDLELLVHTAAPPLRERTRGRLHVRVSGGRAIVGMFGVGSHEPVEVATCLLLHPILEEARQHLAPLFEGAHGRGEASLALGYPHGPLPAPKERQAVLDVRWEGTLPAQVFARFEKAVNSGAFAGIRALVGESLKPLVVGDPTPWLLGADGNPLRLAPGGFAQASELGNRVLAERVRALVASLGRPARAVELYAGAGNFSVLLAPLADELITVESVGPACVAARENLAARGLKAKVVEADAATYDWPSSTSLVVLDPPRTGAKAVCDRLLASRVRHVVYVSCDPGTLRRDLELLSSSYDVTHAESVEMFPNTHHVESIVVLQRRRSPDRSQGQGKAS